MQKILFSCENKQERRSRLRFVRRRTLLGSNQQPFPVQYSPLRPLDAKFPLAFIVKPLPPPSMETKKTTGVLKKTAMYSETFTYLEREEPRSGCGAGVERRTTQLQHVRAFPNFSDLVCILTPFGSDRVLPAGPDLFRSPPPVVGPHPALDLLNQSPCRTGGGFGSLKVTLWLN